MTGPFPVPKPGPTCGRPMMALSDNEATGRLRYVCTYCADPLHDPAAKCWAERAEAACEVAGLRVGAVHLSERM